MKQDARIYVAGHRGLAGSAIVRRLQHEGYHNFILHTRAEVDLTDRSQVDAMFQSSRPEYVFVAAAKVGGILANDTYPADFIRENLAIALNVIDAAYRHDVTKLLFLSSSCVYPKHAPQPMREEYLLTGALEPTNEPYAVAKIAGMKLCEAYYRQYQSPFFSVLPTNLYGPNDNFDLATSHVLPALIRKFHDAKINRAPAVVLWGTGQPRREFMHVDDLADAVVFLLGQYDEPGPINAGTGEEVSISELARAIGEVAGFKGRFVFDPSKPDGAPRKLIDSSRLRAMGWRHSFDLRGGLEQTYAWYKQSAAV